MKKICFVQMGNIDISPYINSYLSHINYSCDIIYWDRENKKNQNDENNYYRFNFPIRDTNMLAKSYGYIRFKKYVENILTNGNYDIVICLQTCGALLLSNILMKKYDGKFIVDIRDYNYEKLKFVYKMEERLFLHAKACIISSEGYKSFLPEYDYIIAHNLRVLPRSRVDNIRNRNKNKETINIAFIGFCAYQNQYRKLLINLKNDNRFHMSFIGTRAEELKDFCIDEDINNVTIIGTFDSDKILDLYENVDLINNLYGNHTPVFDYALSNKLYFAAELDIPILTCPDTFMSEIANKYNFGISVNVDDADLGDKLYAYYNTIDWTALTNGTQEFLDKVYEEQKRFETFLSDIF